MPAMEGGAEHKGRRTAREENENRDDQMEDVYGYFIVAVIERGGEHEQRQNAEVMDKGKDIRMKDKHR